MAEAFAVSIFAQQTNQDGSCLVELLLVLVIIGIRLSISFPVYSLIIRRTEEAVCSTHSAHLNTMTHLDSRVPPEKAGSSWLCVGKAIFSRRL